MEELNYRIEEREYVVRFIFDNKFEAMKFKLPKLYSFRFELNQRIAEEDKYFIRVAQVKVNG